LFLYLSAQEEVEGRPDGRDGGQLGQLGEAGGDGGTQDVSGELELEPKGQEAPQVQPHRGERSHPFPAERDDDETTERDRCPYEDDDRAGSFDDTNGDIDDVAQVLLTEAGGEDHHWSLCRWSPGQLGRCDLDIDLDVPGSRQELERLGT